MAFKAYRGACAGLNINVEIISEIRWHLKTILLLQSLLSRSREFSPSVQDEYAGTSFLPRL